MMATKHSLGNYSSPSESMTVKLEIPDFTNQMTGGADAKVESPIFTIRGKDLRIIVTPNDRNNKSIGVYLGNYSEDTVTAKFTVKTYKLTILNKKEIGAGENFGLTRYMSHREYRWFMKSADDVFRLELEVTLYFSAKDMNCSKKSNLGPIETALANCNIREEEIFSDFSLVSKEGKRFPCHRLILGTQSPVLMAMMVDDMKEKMKNEVKLEYGEEIVKLFVDYFYTGEVPHVNLGENMKIFLELADFYDLGSLKLQTEKAAFSKMSCENMVDMYVLADLYRAENLKEAAENLIKKNKDTLKKQDLSGLPVNIYVDIVKILC